MRKYTHALMLGFSLIFVILMTATNFWLKSAVAAYNFDDPYRHFVRQEMPDFRYIAIQIGNILSKNTSYPAQLQKGGAALISQSEKPVLYIHEDVKDSLKWHISGDTLYLRGYNNKKRVHTAAQILTPRISGLSACRSNAKLEGFVADSIAVYADQLSQIEMKNSKLNVCYLYMNEATVHLRDSSVQLQSLHVAQGVKSTLNCEDTRLQRVYLPADQTTFSLRMSGESLKIVQNQPN